MSSLNNVNKYTYMHVVTGTNYGQVSNFCFMQLSCCYAIQVFFYFLYTLLYDPTASGTSVDPTSQVHSSTMLVLPIIQNLKVRF
jgi:hypothetical protein